MSSKDAKGDHTTASLWAPLLFFIGTSAVASWSIKNVSTKRPVQAFGQSVKDKSVAGGDDAAANLPPTGLLTKAKSLLLDKQQVLKLRQQYTSSSLSISYLNSDPVMFIKARGCYMFDQNNTRYLDTRNNVAHVGHAHPVVTRATQDQVANLVTNTRYLHPNMAVLAERLVASMNINNIDNKNIQYKVFFTNSGSEANDLALRLARAYATSNWQNEQQQQQSKSTNDTLSIANNTTVPELSYHTIVVEHAYHGHTLGTLNVSPYKFSKGTEFVPPKTTHVVPAPDTYRGEYRNVDTAGPLYAEHVQKICADIIKNRDEILCNDGNSNKSKIQLLQAMIIESGMSVAGVILPPPGYLEACQKAVHSAGGILILDEVQTGLGRIGTHTWAWQQGTNNNTNFVPDIVTFGKPLGNGMPLAGALVHSRIVQAFEECKIEYFNTFAGNPVCAAAGLAVLDVLEQEELQETALRVGAYLKTRLAELQTELYTRYKQQLHDGAPPHCLVGDIRGSGLFIGVEFVRNDESDNSSKSPATNETSFICSVLKSKHHILTSIDGPFNNVIVIKPPMVFDKNNVDCLVECLKDTITNDLDEAMTSGELYKMSLTPT